ncbi:hypothetical protein [Methylobacterium fujisawaense]|uniref:hypothetical protein n=1 Tax=Methylobacterium fujisawaense TaxID=107400 RepID=UPI00313BEBC5
MNVETMERIMEFCMGKIPDDDLMKLDEMLSSQIPAKAMAADAAIKRREILAMDCQARGYSVTRKRVLKAVAEDRAAIEALHPHMFRLGSGNSIGFAAPMPAKPSRPMTEAERDETAKAFPNMFKEH